MFRILTRGTNKPKHVRRAALDLFSGPDELSNHPDTGDELHKRGRRDDRGVKRDGPEQRQSAHTLNAIDNARTPSGWKCPCTTVVRTATPTRANPKTRLTEPTIGSGKLSHGTVNTNAQSRYRVSLRMEAEGSSRQSERRTSCRDHEAAESLGVFGRSFASGVGRRGVSANHASGPNPKTRATRRLHRATSSNHEIRR